MAPAPATPLPAVGVFVGGQGRRMGGVAKGLLVHEGQTLVERVLGVCRQAAGSEAPSLYLVGDYLVAKDQVGSSRMEEASAYSDSSARRLEDRPAGVGPIGGLRALLLQARAHGRDAVALAVDLPHLQAGVVRRLYVERPGLPVLAPREVGRWQPLLARYRPAVVLPVIDRVLARGHTSLQSIFAELAANGSPAEELVLSEDERQVLRDWDLPSDMHGKVPGAEP
jgi:molybdopterin-guanine dinucleotide biosynthesis protein A